MLLITYNNFRTKVPYFDKIKNTRPNLFLFIRKNDFLNKK